MFALRLASLILRSRTDARLPFLRVAADAGGFAIDLPQSWLDDNPLSADALEAEARHWKAVGMKLEVSGLSDKKVSVLKQSPVTSPRAPRPGPSRRARGC